MQREDRVVFNGRTHEKVNQPHGIIVLREVCDPVERSLYYEAPNGTVVGDFALPDWYVPGSPGPYDYLGQVPGAWQLLSGGYVSYQSVELSGWQQATAETVAKVAATLRDRASEGNPRVDLLRKQQAKDISGLRSSQPAAVSQSRQQGDGGNRGASATTVRQQTARGQGVTIVPRNDVQRPRPDAEEVGRQRGTNGVRAQTIS
jgi:hypothetical protein